MISIGARTTGGIATVTVINGGTGYTSAPTVQIGTGGASAYAVVAAGKIQQVVVTRAGTSYASTVAVSFSGGSGSGASAVAYPYTGPLRPMTFFKGRYNDMYGVDGMGRGIRWDGEAASVEPIGVAPPTTGLTVTASTTTNSGFVSSVQIVAPGAGYHNVPTVAFTGGTPTTAAQARASVANGRVTGITITNPGMGYQATPSVSITGGIATGAAFTVGVVGKVDSLALTNLGSGYTSNGTTSPSVSFSTAQGLTGALATVSVASDGTISGVQLISAGTGATTSGVTATISGGGGTGAAIAVDMMYGVNAVTVGNSGSGFYAAPVITVRPAASDTRGRGAALTSSVNGSGNVNAVTVLSAGEYYAIPTALVQDSQATATATLSQAMRGKYKCCVRYIDDTPESAGGPIPSVISELLEVDTGAAASTLTWTLSALTYESRVTAVELWRTTSDQSVILFRVATIAVADLATPYVDSLSDDSLKDPERANYGLMPITLPSGQINARRFQVPPGEFAVGVMFQDRAWYAVDATGQRPNTLMFSEVDEPESVPYENELVVQENTGTPDRIVALVPLGSQLLVLQSSHLYRLNYVAQPVIDASIILGGYRGILNARCWDVLGGVAFIVDSTGMYAYDGQQEDAISVAVDNFWRDGIIDLSKADKFHVRSDFATRTVRFYYCKSTDTDPVRALCYCISTKAWWEEEYPHAVMSSAAAFINQSRTNITGTQAGGLRKSGGLTDSGSPIAYQFRSGNSSLDSEGSRSIGLLYRPTASDADVTLQLHYNNSATPRPNAISTDRGVGVTATQNGHVSVNMKKTRSALGDSNGYAAAYFAGRNDPRSAGADRHIAVAITGSQTGATPDDAVVIHGMLIEGAK